MVNGDGEDREETGTRQENGGFPLPLSLEPGKARVLWSVAGFDPSGGAGITADLMTFAAHGFFGCSAITALTVQSTLGVFGWQPVAPGLLRETLQRLHEDVPAAGIKLGMLGTPEAAESIAEFLGAIAGNAGETGAWVVWDPVLRSSSGRDLYPSGELGVLRRQLLPRVGWVTPNWLELELLSEHPVHDLVSAEGAARGLAGRHPGLTVLVTGGDQDAPTDLLVLPGCEAVVLPGRRVATQATHGTGCALSSALLAQLAGGCAHAEAARRAKEFVEGALEHAPGIGHGHGPMGLLWPLLARQERR